MPLPPVLLLLLVTGVTHNASPVASAAGLSSHAAELDHHSLMAPGAKPSLFTPTNISSASKAAKSLHRVLMIEPDATFAAPPNGSFVFPATVLQHRAGDAVAINHAGGLFRDSDSPDQIFDDNDFDDDEAMPSRMLLSGRDAHRGFGRWGLVKKTAAKAKSWWHGGKIETLDPNLNKADLDAMTVRVNGQENHVARAEMRIAKGEKAQKAADSRLDTLTAQDVGFKSRMAELKSQDEKFDLAHTKVLQWQTASDKQTLSIIRKQDDDVAKLQKKIKEEMEDLTDKRKKLEGKMETRMTDFEAYKEETKKKMRGLIGGIVLALLIISILVWKRCRTPPQSKAGGFEDPGFAYDDYGAGDPHNEDEFS